MKPEDIAEGLILPREMAIEMVLRMQRMEVYQLGSQEFLRQHSDLQKLNMQAHQNYAHDSDEWISELLDTHDKWDVIVYNLLSCYTFRTEFSGRLVDEGKLEEHGIQASILLYSIFFHEAVLLDLLAVRAVDQLPHTKYQLELIDYLSYRLDQAILNRFNHEASVPKTLKEELKYSEEDLSFKAVMASFVLVRAFACQKVSLQASHKMKTHRWHYKVAQILAVQDKVYERYVKRGDEKVLELYEDGEWRPYEKMSERHFRIYKVQGQLLVALLGLSMIQDQYSNTEIQTFDQLKGTLNDSLVDQLPPLKELRSFYEKLSFQQYQQDNSELQAYQQKVKEQFGIEEGPTRGNGVVMIDVVSQLYAQIETRNRLFAEQRVERHAEQQTQKAPEPGFFMTQNDDGSIALSGKAAQQQKKPELSKAEIIGIINREIIQRVKQFNVATQTLENDYDKVFPTCKCGKTAKFRCAKCKNVWYCGRQCQVDDWKAHKLVCGKATAQKKEEDEIQSLLKRIEATGQKVEYE